MKAMLIVMALDLVITCIVLGGAGIVAKCWPLVILAILMYVGFGSTIIWIWRNDD